ncbi:MAG: 3'-5' exoribonuclease YhaM family protein [Terriglobales bacterium]
MKNFYVADAASRADDPKQREFQSTFLVVSKQLKPKRTGGDYLAIVLCDRTGQIEAKMWDNIQQFVDKFEADDVVTVKGYVNRFNGRPQLIIQTIVRADPATVDFGDFLPKTDKNIDELWARLGEYVAMVENPHLRALLEAFMRDERIATAFRAAPAAKTLHHAYIGGLLDHVVSLLSLCELACRNYPFVNRDLVFAGAFLHDIGKIHELSYARSFGYTTRGQLLGHMIIELEMVQEKLATVPDFPNELKLLLEHLIISHHGHYEFGSPKLPMFPEALMLHYLDDLDSKMESMRAQCQREAGTSNPWAGWNSSLARPLLDSRKFLDSTEEKADAAAAE